MSDAKSNAPEETDASAGASKGSSIRKFALYGLLAIMIVAIVYDYRVARPAVDDAYDKIATASVAANSDATEILTNQKVQELLGKQPAETFKDGNDLVEVYHFSGGLPGRPHRLWAVFKKNGENNLFYRHAKFAYEASSTVSPVNEVMVGTGSTTEEVDPRALAAADNEQMAGSGSRTEEVDPGAVAAAEADDDGHGGGPGDGLGPAEEEAGGARGERGGGERGGGERGGPGGDRRGGGGFPDAGEILAQYDADGDGKLTGDEITGRMADNLDRVDTDGNGEVTLKELETRFAAMREGRGGGGRGAGGPGGGGRGGPGGRDGGGGGRGGGEGGGAERGRPELE